MHSGGDGGRDRAFRKEKRLRIRLKEKIEPDSVFFVVVWATFFFADQSSLFKICLPLEAVGIELRAARQNPAAHSLGQTDVFFITN